MTNEEEEHLAEVVRRSRKRTRSLLERAVELINELGVLEDQVEPQPEEEPHVASAAAPHTDDRDAS